MTDSIHIQSLTTMAIIGIHEWEQKIRQKLLIDITLYLDLRACQDDLNNSVDYASLCEVVTNFIESQSFRLIETVAEQVITLIKERFGVTRVQLTVSKPHAVNNARNVAVTLIR